MQRVWFRVYSAHAHALKRGSRHMHTPKSLSEPEEARSSNVANNSCKSPVNPRIMTPTRKLNGAPKSEHLHVEQRRVKRGVTPPFTIQVPERAKHVSESTADSFPAFFHHAFFIQVAFPNEIKIQNRKIAYCGYGLGEWRVLPRIVNDTTAHHCSSGGGGSEIKRRVNE
jgi:hypothetical protein